MKSNNKKYMSKTTKKNNAAIEWPSNTHFTIDDLAKQYPNFINITLRFRVNRAIDNKEIVAIGKIKPAIGRPRLVFVKANPSAEILAAATAAGVLPIEEKTSTVTVAEMTTTAPKKAEKKTVAAPVTNQVQVTA
jgi:hypothetical protein